MSGRIFPPFPRVGVSLALFRGREVVLARRGTGAGQGLWSLPGGLIELGETAEAAALREMHEEVGLYGQILGLAGHTNIIERAGEGIRQHYVVLTFAGNWISGVPRPSAEAPECRWVDFMQLGGLNMTKGLPDMLRQCALVAGVAS